MAGAANLLIAIAKLAAGLVSGSSAMLSEAAHSIGDRLGDDDASFDSAEARVALKPLMSRLDRRERIMLEMRFFKGSTQAEIGAVLGITQMQVSRLLSALLARLRDELGGVPL